MRSIRAALLAGCAATGLAIAGGAAQAQQNPENPAVHVMTIQLPGGGVGQIQYTGNVPPRVYVSDAPVSTVGFAPMPSLFGSDSPFAAFERISADMDRQMESILQRAAALSSLPITGPIAAPPQVTEAALRSLPPGTQSFTYVSTLSGNGVCTRSVEVTAAGNGAAPRVVSHTSGNCAAQPEAGASGIVTAPNRSAPVKRPDVLWTKNEARHPYAAMVQKAALPQ